MKIYKNEKISKKRIEDLSCCLNIYILRFSTEDTKKIIFFIILKIIIKNENTGDNLLSKHRKDDIISMC